MYSLVPAMVSIMIFWVLSPKSANLIWGRDFPTRYLDLSRMFYGFRSLWVILWLCSSWTPLLTCKIHSSACFYPILLSLHKLSASLAILQSTKGSPPNSTQWCTRPCQVGRWYRIFSGCFSCQPSWVLRWCAFPCRYRPDRPETFWPCGWQLNLFANYRRCGRPA